MRDIPVEPCLGLIHTFEGSAGAFEATRTQDPSGNWEIGWSHKLAGPTDPLWGATMTQASADALAIQDLATAAIAVCNTLGVAVDSLTDGQYAACIDFTYNEGGGRFAGSTLAHFIKTGAMHLVPVEFAKWVYGNVGGTEQVLPGLQARREAEIKVWLS